ncbi:hypothetical protein LINPERHAP2_LOCUS7270 [Linum perenne]
MWFNLVTLNRRVKMVNCCCRDCYCYVVLVDLCDCMVDLCECMVD